MINAPNFSPKILIASGFWPTYSNKISGIFVVQQVAAIIRLGCSVTVIVMRPIWRRPEQYLPVTHFGLSESAVQLYEFPVIQLPNKLTSLPGALRINAGLTGWAVARQLDKLARANGGFNGCIAHGGRYMGLALPWWRGKVGGEVALVLHGVDPALSNPKNCKMVSVLFSRVASVADTVVLVGNPLVAHAQCLGISKDKIRVILNGTELPGSSSVSCCQRKISEVRRVVSVSNLVKLKGVDLNLHALARIYSRRPNLQWEYRVVGDGPERTYLLTLAQQLGIDGRVKFLGRLDYEQTMREVAKADVFALPSWGEAFGIVYLEAMARMRPVIGCFENGAADIITHRKDGLLVPPREVQALTEALQELIENPDLCSEMGREGRRIAERYSWENNARQVLKLISIEMGAVQ